PFFHSLETYHGQQDRYRSRPQAHPPTSAPARLHPAHTRPWPARESGARCRYPQQEEPRQALQEGRLIAVPPGWPLPARGHTAEKKPSFEGFLLGAAEMARCTGQAPAVPMAAMITVHHLETSRSQRVLWLLEEL